MQKIVVAKLVRLAKDGDSFKKDIHAQVMRTNAKVSEQYINEFNVNWQTRGQLYIIDEKLTKERDEALLKGEVKVKEVKKVTEEKQIDPKKAIRDALKKEADELGLEYRNNLSNEKLAELISNAKQ